MSQSQIAVSGCAPIEDSGPSLQQSNTISTYENILQAKEDNANQNHEPGDVKQVPPTILDHDLSLEERRRRNVEQRQRRIEQTHLEQILAKKHGHRIQEEQIKELIAQQKRESQQRQKSLWHVLRGQMMRNVQLEQKREEKLRQHDIEQKQMDSAYVHSILQYKQKNNIQQSLDPRGACKTLPAGDKGLMHRPSVLQQRKQRQHGDNSGIGLSQKRQLNIAFRDEQINKNQLRYIFSMKIQKQVAEKELYDKIQAEKSVTSGRKQKILIGKQYDEYRYHISEEYEEKFKAQSMKLKERYERERFFAAKKKSESKIYKSERQRAILEKKRENRNKYLEQLASDSKLEQVRYENQLERQRVWNNQLKEMIAAQKQQKLQYLQNKARPRAGGNSAEGLQKPTYQQVSEAEAVPKPLTTTETKGTLPGRPDKQRGQAQTDSSDINIADLLSQK